MPSAEPVTFVVESMHGRECPSIIVGKLPDRLTRKSLPKLLVYSLRLDTLPNAEALMRMSTGELYALFVLFVRKAGKLP